MAFILDTVFWKTVTLLTLPVVLAGILHMIVVKIDALSYLKIPLHPSWFGANKTWRGVVVMPLFTILGVNLSQQIATNWQMDVLVGHSGLWLGVILGIAYVLPELPNSYIKRRLGVRPGEMSEQNPWLFALIDQADSVIGCVLAYALLGIGNVTVWLSLLVLGTGVHLLINVVLWALGLRKHPL